MSPGVIKLQALFTGGHTQYSTTSQRQATLEHQIFVCDHAHETLSCKQLVLGSHLPILSLWAGIFLFLGLHVALTQLVKLKGCEWDLEVSQESLGLGAVGACGGNGIG